MIFELCVCFRVGVCILYKSDDERLRWSMKNEDLGVKNEGINYYERYI